MANLQLLNNVDHANIKVDVSIDAKYGDAVGGCLVFPSELVALEKEFPVVLQKDQESSEFQLIALFGFFESENLYLTEHGWQARYTPAILRKEPFMIGFQKDSENPNDSIPVIHIDTEHARVNDDGQPLFFESGGVTPLLEAVKKNLMLIHSGVNDTKALVKVLLENDLIESFVLDAQFDDEQAIKMSNFYTINIDKVHALDDTLIAELHKKGYLQLIYLLHFSFSNLKVLVQRRNERFPKVS